VTMMAARAAVPALPSRLGTRKLFPPSGPGRARGEGRSPGNLLLLLLRRKLTIWLFASFLAGFPAEWSGAHHIGLMRPCSWMEQVPTYKDH
jgi:hypothetical protein